MKKGKISVIIPVYNGEKWLAGCVESVLAQSYANFEVLILDDSSEDQTWELAQGLAKKDARIRAITRENKGVSAARNQGIREAEGEYITFVDADDKLDGRMLETLLGILKKEKSDIAVCGYRKWDGGAGGEPVDADRAPGKADVECRKDACARSTAEADGAGGHPSGSVITLDRETYVSDYLLRGNTRCWSILYRRSVIGKVRFRENLSIGEDMMFLVDLLEKISRVSITDYAGYFYRINEKGAMLRPFTPSYMDEIKSWRLAASVIGWDYPKLKAKVNSNLAVSAMLVAGKLSRLEAGERRQYRDCTEKCRLTVKEALKVSGAREELPPGYGIKTGLFTACPGAYLKLYHRWKRGE